MAGKGCGVGEDAVVADLAVVADMGVGHDQAMAADVGGTPSADGPARDGDAFSDDGLFADLGAGGLVLVFQVLRSDADAGERKKSSAGADGQVSIENDVRDKLAVFAQHHIGADGGIWANAHDSGTTALDATIAVGWMLTPSLPPPGHSALRAIRSAAARSGVLAELPQAYAARPGT